MNIVLIGYRGTGKSTVGKVLAARLGRPVVSTDTEIVRRAGLTVPEIVAQYGWDHFRDLESAVCRDFSVQDGLIIESLFATRGPCLFGDQICNSNALATAPDAGGGVEG